MREQRARQNPLANAFGLPDAPTLVTRTLHKSAMTVTELKCDRPNLGVTKSIPYEDAYLVALMVRECPDQDLRVDGRPVCVTPLSVGDIMIYDLRRDPVACMRSPFHSLHFYLPRTALDYIADEAGAPRIGDLHYQPGVAIDDPVVRQLLSSLVPAMAKPEEVCPVYVDHVAMALGAHVAHVYGGMQIAQRPPLGGLAPCQERRAKELLSANLNEEVSLSRLAAECGLSVHHFARAFRQSTGVPPHRWLLKHRVERAKELLRNSASPLADVAFECGFADQSHFTRVFTAMVGVSPGAWRRMQ